MPTSVVFTLTAGRSGTRFLAGVLRRNLRRAVVRHEPYLSRSNPSMFGRSIYDHAVGNLAAIRRSAARKRTAIESYEVPLYIETSHAFLKSWADVAVQMFSDLRLLHVLRNPVDTARSFADREAAQDRYRLPFRFYRGPDGRRYRRWHLTGLESVFRHFDEAELTPFMRYAIEWIEVENRAMRFLDHHRKRSDTFTLRMPEALADEGLMRRLLAFLRRRPTDGELVLEGPRNRTPFVRPPSPETTRGDRRELRTVIDRLPADYLRIFEEEPYASTGWADVLCK